MCVDSTQGWSLQVQPMLLRLSSIPERLLTAASQATYVSISTLAFKKIFILDPNCSRQLFVLSHLSSSTGASIRYQRSGEATTNGGLFRGMRLCFVTGPVLFLLAHHHAVDTSTALSPNSLCIPHIFTAEPCFISYPCRRAVVYLTAARACHILEFPSFRFIDFASWH